MMRKSISYLAAGLILVGLVPVAKGAALIDLSLSTSIYDDTNTSVKYDDDNNTDDNNTRGEVESKEMTSL